MRAELRKKLDRNRVRLNQEMNISSSFLASLLARSVISHNHKSDIEARATHYQKADTLIEILKRRSDEHFESFCKILKVENEDLFHLLNESITTNIPTDVEVGNAHGYNISNEVEALCFVEFSELVLGERIGSGGYGTVCKARHPDFLGTLAYKRINAVFINPSKADELKSEAKIQMRLDHPHIVKCLAVVFEPENYGMLLEFMKHGDAKNYLEENNSVRSKLSIIKGVAAGMKYLHSIKPHAVIHGDLKIVNVLIGDDEEAKVCDFGFSRWKEYSKFHSTQAVPLGTATHVSPERWSDSKLRKNEMSDVYSFGITVWEILTLKFPFPNGNTVQIPYWVVTGERPDLGNIPAEVSKNVVDLMVECWDGDTLRRPPFKEISPRLEMELGTL